MAHSNPVSEIFAFDFDLHETKYVDNDQTKLGRINYTITYRSEKKEIPNACKKQWFIVAITA